MSCETDCERIYFDVIEFLAEYEKLPCLWDKNHPEYNNRQMLEQSKVILGKKLRIFDKDILRRKIRSVRGSYNTEIRKIKLSLEGDGQVYIPKLSWFPIADRFLRATTDLTLDEFQSVELPDTTPSLKPRLLPRLPKSRSVRELQVLDKEMKERCLKSDVQETDEYAEFEYLENPEDSREFDDSLNITDDNINGDSVNHSDIDLMDNSESNSSLVPRKRQRNSSFSDVVECLKDIASSSQNEFTAFGKSIGLQLQRLPLNVAVQLQMDIQAHITKTRLKILETTSNDSGEC